MKKLISMILALAVATVLIVGTVFAAKELTHKGGGTITYKTTNAYVQIYGHITEGGNGDSGIQNSYSGNNSKPIDEGGSLSWTSINLSVTDDVSAKFQISITNMHTNDVRVKVDVDNCDISDGFRIRSKATTQYEYNDLSDMTTVLTQGSQKVVYYFEISVSDYLNTTTTPVFSIPIIIEAV